MMRRMSEPRLRAVKVQVAGQTLALRTDAGAGYLRELAAIVDARLAEVRERHQSAEGKRPVSTQALALLCALQLADELVQAQTRERALRDDARARIARILEHVAALEDDQPSPRRRGRRDRPGRSESAGPP